MSFKSAIQTTCALLGFLLAQSAAQATVMIDQSNASIVGGFCYLGSYGDKCGQSFQQSGSNIAGAGVYVHPSYGAGDGSLTISIYSSYGSTLSNANLLAQGTATNINSNSGWIDVYWAPVATLPGTTYYMVLNATNNVVAAFGNTAYVMGNAIYVGNTTTWSGYDLSFRTYTDDGFSAVPLPASLPLAALGLLCLGLSRRRV